MKAIIVGGGVAGTVTAIALGRAGADVTIYEAYGRDGTGSWLSLAVNGLRALDAVGAGERVRAAGFPVARQRLWSSAGRLLGDVARGRRADDHDRSVTLMRADLLRTLRDAARAEGVRYVGGETLVAATPAGHARFASGRQERGDLLVGADGIWSVTRRSLIPGGPEPTYAGIYVLSGRSHGVALDGDTFNLVFGRNGVFLHLTDPAGETWWQAQVIDPHPPTRDAMPDARWLARWAEHERVPSAIIAATTELHSPAINHVLKPPKSWVYGRAVLIGDAAHPVGAGQGAALAIEDGLELAASLSGTESIEDGLRQYELSRRPRITKMVKAAQDNRDLKKAGPVRRRLEEIMMPIVLPRVFERATGWLYDYTPPTSSSASRSMSSPSCQEPSAPRS